SEPNKRLKPKSVCGLMYLSIIKQLFLFRPQIYSILANKPTTMLNYFFLVANMPSAIWGSIMEDF
ncbi:MAG: hypothetical protein MR592_06660, partial [Prevotella sp.]|nr:hypothetical protein [Prevotella sp.]